MKCTNCGAALERKSTFCGYCGTSITSSETAAAPAQAAIMQVIEVPILRSRASSMRAAQPASTNMSDLSPYYQTAFARLQEFSGAASASRWNWTAFFFHWLWYLAKGMWVKAALIVALNIATAGIGVIFFCRLYGPVRQPRLLSAAHTRQAALVVEWR